MPATLKQPIGPVKAFNTGRYYSEEGQKIAIQAWQDEHGDPLVVLVDVTRNIDYAYLFEGHKEALEAAQSTHRMMRMYDQNEPSLFIVTPTATARQWFDEMKATARKQQPAA